MKDGPVRIDPMKRAELKKIAKQVADEAGKVFRDTLVTLLRAKEAMLAASPLGEKSE